MESDKTRFILSTEEFRESDRFLLYKRLRRNRLILYSLRQNFQSLQRAFKNFHKHEVQSDFWSSRNPYLRWNIQKKITTCLLNYLSSTSSIIDISRDISKSELEDNLLVEYEQSVKAIFIDNVEFVFFRKLRNYVLHYSLLDIGVQSSWNHVSGKVAYTYLSTEVLLLWDGWNEKEIQFIKSFGLKIDIEPITYRYHNAFIEIQNLLFISILSKYKTELNILILEMENLYSKGNSLNMSDNLPYRKSTYHYLRYLMRKANIS